MENKFYATARIKPCNNVFVISAMFFLASCAHTKMETSSKGCEVKQLEIQYDSIASNRFSPRSKREFELFQAFITSNDAVAIKNFKKACISKSRTVDTYTTAVGRLYEKSSHRSVWVYAENKLGMNGRLVDLTEAEASELNDFLESISTTVEN